LIADVVAIVAALLVRIAPLSAPFIERHYSNGIYPSIDRAVRAVTAPLPFTLGDVLFFVAVFFLVRYWIVTLRRAGTRRVPVALRVLLRTVAIAAAIFVVGLQLWPRAARREDPRAQRSHR
jgi:hypothetical protein